MNEKVNLNKKFYAKNQYQRVIDTQFSQLANSLSNNIENIEPEVNLNFQINQFFQDYQRLLFDIPKLGVTNSHEYLIKTSSDIIDFTVSSEEISALIDEINALQKQNLELNQQLIELQTSGSI